jgi:hypothetical protein
LRDLSGIVSLVAQIGATGDPKVRANNPRILHEAYPINCCSLTENFSQACQVTSQEGIIEAIQILQANNQRDKFEL